MKAIFLLALAGLGSLWAQSTPVAPPSAPMAAPSMPDLPDSAVVAIFHDGTKFTMGEFKKIYATLPPIRQQAALRDREQWLHGYDVFRRLTKMAEEAKIDQTSPYKESLAWQRMDILAMAQISTKMNEIVVEPGEIAKYYDSHQQKYTQVRVKAIYIAFSDDAASSAAKGKKPLTEAEAKAKAAKLLAAIKGGADFVKLVKENSDDETSRAKDGNFDTLRISDNIPDAFRAAVFALKPGEVTQPLKQPNGFYLLRAEEVTVRPLSEVRDDIYAELKNAHADEWMRALDQETKVQIVSPEFVGGHPAPAKK